MAAPTANSRPRAAKAAAEAPPVVDLDAARAQRLEAGGGSVTVRFGGEDFTFPNPSEWDARFLNLLRDGDLLGAVEVLLADDKQYQRFLELRPRMGDVEELFDRVGALAGTGGLGNSSGLRTSSRSTRKR